MRQRLVITGGAVLGTIGVAVAVILMQGGGESVSAQEVAQRAAQAQTELLDQVGPDTTIHGVFLKYEPTNQNVQPGSSFVRPENTRSESWSYFDAAGALAQLRTEIYDESTGELYQTVVYANEEITYTDHTTGATETRPFKWSVEALLQSLTQITDDTAGLVLNPESAARTARVDGSDAYLVERNDPRGGMLRVFVDQRNFRFLKSELIDESGAVVESSAMPVFEIVPGNTVPSS